MNTHRIYKKWGGCTSTSSAQVLQHYSERATSSAQVLQHYLVRATSSAQVLRQAHLSTKEIAS